MLKLDGGFEFLAVPRKFRLLIRTRRRLALDELSRILEWDFDQLTVVHGDVVERDAKTAMRNTWSCL